jgi:hypothetical protein
VNKDLREFEEYADTITRSTFPHSEEMWERLEMYKDCPVRKKNLDE